MIPILVGGTGRSGTTILAKILGAHTKIYNLPVEVRFVTDPDGLLSLKHALVDDWSFFQADIAIERFSRLLKNLSARRFGPYPNVALTKVVGAQFYSEWTTKFIDQLVEASFKSAWGARANLFRKVMLRIFGKNKFTRLFLETSYLTSPLDASEFYDLANKFLLWFFNQAAYQHGKEFCLDATPSNLLHADFWHRCCPTMKLIHIYRDPRDVVSSFSTKDWGAPQLKQNLMWIVDTLEKWEEVKVRIPTESYIEIKFEELIEDTASLLKKIFGFLDIEFQKRILDVDLSKHNIGRWKETFSGDFKRYFYDNYAYILQKYDYK